MVGKLRVSESCSVQLWNFASNDRSWAQNQFKILHATQMTWQIKSAKGTFESVHHLNFVFSFSNVESQSSCLTDQKKLKATAQVKF